MKIKRITTAVVEANYDYTYIRVYTDKNDLVGTGEIFFAPGLTAVVRDLAEVVIGEDPRAIDYLAKKMRRATSHAGTNGVTHHAITGIETALWDILGKSLNAPVYQLLGGKWRDEVRIYADSHGGHTLESMGPCAMPRQPRWMPKIKGGTADTEGQAFNPAAYAKQAKKVVAKGFDAIKFDIDIFKSQFQCETRPLNNEELALQIELVSAVREAVGPKVDIAIDCHWRYSFGDALKICWGCEPYQLLWLEDPMPPENNDNLGLLSRQTRTPICTGENLVLAHGFRKLCETNACQIIAPDFQKAGGILEAKRICDLAESYNIQVAPHCIASPIGTIQAAHVSAAIPNFLVLEFHGQDVPFWDELGVVSGHKGAFIRGGLLRVPNAPGFGVELNEKVARQYAKEGESFFA